MSSKAKNRQKAIKKAKNKRANKSSGMSMLQLKSGVDPFEVLNDPSVDDETKAIFKYLYETSEGGKKVVALDMKI